MEKSLTDRSTGLLSPVAFQIMLSLAETPRHGYGIKLDIEDRTGGSVRLGSGTLYETIQRLEALSFINERPAPTGGVEDGRKRRFYGLTAHGRRALEAELVRLDEVLAYARERKLLPETQ